MIFSGIFLERNVAEIGLEIIFSGCFITITGGHRLPRTPDFVESTHIKPEVQSPTQSQKKSLKKSSSVVAHSNKGDTSPLLQTNRKSMIPVQHSPAKVQKKSFSQDTSNNTDVSKENIGIPQGILILHINIFDQRKA